MPEKLVQFFINFLTNKSAIVLDSFDGSNTTGTVAQDLGRRWVFVEQSKEYVMALRQDLNRAYGYRI